MSQKLTHKFKNPNPNLNNNQDYEEWIDFWTFNENGSNKIRLSPKVILDSSNLTNENQLVTKILDASNNFWKSATQNNEGYVPKTTINSFLYAGNNGAPTWIQPTYDKVTYNEEVSVTIQKPADNNGRFILNGIINEENEQVVVPPILTKNGQSNTDYILDLNNFLWNSISATINGTITPTSLTIPSNTNT